MMVGKIFNIFVLLLSSTLPILIICKGHIGNERRHLLDGARCKRNDECKSSDCRGRKCGGRDIDSWCIDDEWCSSYFCFGHKCVHKPPEELLRFSSEFSNEDKTFSTFVFKLYRYGIGSNFIHMLAFKSHFEEHGYDFVVNEAIYDYKYQNEGILTAFFDTNILHVLHENDLQSLENRYEPFPWLKERGNLRAVHPTKGLPYYEWLSKETCKSLQFSKVGMERINNFIGEKPMPVFSDNTVSVGFHIRRGDKLKHESGLYEGHEYVEKALNATNGRRIDACFVASDDFEAGEELKRALLDKKVGCKFYTLDESTEHGNERGITSDEETMRFIAELSILSKVTYFVGTFNSNVGVLVSLLRSCYTKDRNHFYQSYSISGKGGSDEAPWWR